MTTTRQWLHGFLDLCLLALLEHHSDYGYGLAQRLADHGVGDIPGGTLYPALLRLEQRGAVTSGWASSEAGPRRKYYALTDAGRQILAEQSSAWARFRSGIDTVVGVPTTLTPPPSSTTPDTTSDGAR